MQPVQVEPRMDKGTSEGTPWPPVGGPHIIHENDPSVRRVLWVKRGQTWSPGAQGWPAVTLGLFGCSGSRPGRDLGSLQLSSPGLQAEATLDGVGRVLEN